MQEGMGNFMANEARKAIEAPQNYGFTSVVKDAIQGLSSAMGGTGGSGAGGMGSIVSSAESFMQFMGGNRSFPVFGNMDDRRHRLMNLDKGDSAMFSTQGRKQQVQMASDGVYHSTPNDQTWRTALLDESSEQDQSSQSYQAQQAAQLPGGVAHKAALALLLKGKIKHISQPMTEPIQGVPTLYDPGGTGSATSGTNAGGSFGGMQMGQKSLKSKNSQAKMFLDITKDATRAAGKIVQLIMAQGGSGGGGGGSKVAASAGGSSGGSQSQGTILAEASSDSKFYCGGTPKKGKYALIVTVKGPTINVPGRIG